MVDLAAYTIDMIIPARERSSVGKGNSETLGKIERELICNIL